MKNILGLDLGTNSIGWAVVKEEINNEGEKQLIGIEAAGSRIIPMDAAMIGDFEKGNKVSQTANRTKFRSARRMRERNLLRRERLHRILDLIGFLPKHYSDCLTRYGKFVDNVECKLAWKKNMAGKYEFIFQNSYNEMLLDFYKYQPQIITQNKKIPYDWTIYYLRKKALAQKISKEELAWILLNFNQKRGYYQREEEKEEDSKQLVEYQALKVIEVEATEEKKGKEVWYNIHLENGMIYRRTSKFPLDWVGRTKEFIITTSLDDKGQPKLDKDGNIKRSFRVPKDDDWTLLKKRTENILDKSEKTVGENIYETLLNNPTQKIIGKYIRVIERKYYKKELETILDVQRNFHDELNDRNLYEKCIEELYSNNEAHRRDLSRQNFTKLFVDDILFYQRPLRSKKVLIDNCPLESHSYVDKATGEIKRVPLKCIAKSQPLYQEFRLWQFVANLKLYERQKVVNGRLCADVDISSELLKNDDDVVSLFDWLNEKEKIDQKSILKYFGKKEVNYRWNYVDKPYPCNETRAAILSRLQKAKIDKTFLTEESEYALWHILYSVEDKNELVKALTLFAEKHKLCDAFVDQFKMMPPFKKEYGSYSAKAIKNLLPFMRKGKYWNATSFSPVIQKRIEKIINQEFDETIKDNKKEQMSCFTDIKAFQGLPLWLACQIVYGNHVEDKWKTPSDIDIYLLNFKQHSLHNPVVEQVVLETLRTVRDIWKQFGTIDEIHVELGRDMKNPAGKRAEITKRVLENENTNLRIKALLIEFMNPDFKIDNVRPYSPSQQDILRIYEEEVLESVSEIPSDIQDILAKFNQSDKSKRPSHSDVVRYKLWLEQKYVSPYTGETIPLGKLFTPYYEIEHIIPQSRYFDDSFSNKVICESAVNKLKDNNLGYEFIKKHEREIVDLGGGQKIKILSVSAYEQLVKEKYSGNSSKIKKLLMEDIPENFINRQMNDSRYISKLIKSLLSNIVREDGEQDDISKNVIPCTGGITDRLKKDWGINDVWNKIILPRFERLNDITQSNHFTAISTNNHMIPTVPLEFQKGFNKKRLDHRHHAMDAIVIACATRNIVNYLNNESASSNATCKRSLLQPLVCEKKFGDNGNYNWIVRKPWEKYTQDTYSILQSIIVSFKQNLRVINKTTNQYIHYENDKKIIVCQTKGDSWSIRKPMHKDTVYGEVNLRKIKPVTLSQAIKNPKTIVDKDLKTKLLAMLELGYDKKQINKYFDENKETWPDVNVSKIPVYFFTKDTSNRYFATRKSLIDIFDKVTDSKNAKEIIEQITDTGIQKILLNYLETKQDNPEIAFSADGIDELNENITVYNNGCYHQPIYKVRKYEMANKFAIGARGNKKDKFVECAKGTNLFFAIYEVKTKDELVGETVKKRRYETIPFNVAVDREKQNLTPAPSDENGNAPKYVLSPNDLVYLPTKEELKENCISQPLDKKRIYKFIDSCNDMANFVPYSVASIIYCVPKIFAKKFFNRDCIQNEFGLGSPQSKNQRAITGEMIKELCVPIKVDRLGNIIKIG